MMTNEEINNVFEAVIDHRENLKSQTNNYNINRLPTVNSDFIRLSYYEIKDKLNMTVHFLGSESHFCVSLLIMFIKLSPENFCQMKNLKITSRRMFIMYHKFPRLCHGDI